MDRIKKWIGIGVPGGIDDVVIRAVKTGVAVLLASPVADALRGGDAVSLVSVKAAVFAALAAAVSVLINAALIAAARFAQS